MLLSIIIPMYNENPIAEACVKSLAAELESSGAELISEYEIIFSDDGSTDGCGETVRKCAQAMKLSRGTIRVIRSDKNYGKGHAVRLGMMASRGELAVFTDCDLAYGCAVILKMAEHMLSDNTIGVLIGSRAISPDGYSGYTPLRRIASKVYMKFLAASAGFKYTDSQCGIKMFRGSAAHEIFALASVDGWAFDLELLLLSDKRGITIKEHPVTVINHRASKVRLISDSFRMARDVRKIKKRIRALEC